MVAPVCETREIGSYFAAGDTFGSTGPKSRLTLDARGRPHGEHRTRGSAALTVSGRGRPWVARTAGHAVGVSWHFGLRLELVPPHDVVSLASCEPVGAG